MNINYSSVFTKQTKFQDRPIKNSSISELWFEVKNNQQTFSINCPTELLFYSTNQQQMLQKPKNETEILIASLQQNGDILQFASEKQKNEIEIVLEAVKENGNALQFASEKLKNNKELVLVAIQHSGSIRYASKELKNDKEIVSKAVAQNNTAIREASFELQHDKEFLLNLAEKINPHVLIHIHGLGNLSLTKKSFCVWSNKTDKN
jgi:hypothetical protein